MFCLHHAILTLFNHRVTYKLAVLPFNMRLTLTPAYLCSLISNRVTASRMSLRSLTHSLMAVPRTNTVCVSRSISMCAPVVWYSLPLDIQLCSFLKTFKSKLKKFLFCRAFEIWLTSWHYINDFTYRWCWIEVCRIDFQSLVLFGTECPNILGHRFGMELNKFRGTVWNSFGIKLQLLKMSRPISNN